MCVIILSFWSNRTKLKQKTPKPNCIFAFNFQIVVSKIISNILEDIGPIPGRYHRVRPDSLFKVSITEKFTKYLLKAGLQTLSVKKTDTPNCGNSIKCKEFETLGINFIQKIEIAYFKRATTSPDVLSERPDFYLGRFLSMFSDFIFNFSIDLSTYDTNFLLEEEQLVWIII